jgi:hypothetical protein
VRNKEVTVCGLREGEKRDGIRGEEVSEKGWMKERK